MAKQLSNASKSEIIKLFNEGCSIAEISSRTELSLRTVNRVLGNLPMTGAKPEKKAVVDARKRAAWLKAQGWALTDIAKKTGLKVADINDNWRNWAHKYKIEIPAPRQEPAPVTYGPIITYKLVDGRLVRQKSEYDSIRERELVYDEDEVDETDPITKMYRKMLEKGEYDDE